MKYDISEDFEHVLVNGFASMAFIVKPAGEDEYEQAVLVYADNERLACEIGACEMNGEPDCCEARRAPEHDERARLFLAGRAEGDPEYMREAGWHLEDEWSCCSCGLYAMGMEKYAVCRESHVCKACGCDSDPDPDEPGPCQHGEGFSCE